MLKSVYSALGVLISVVLARALEPEGFGIYAYFFAIATTCAVFAQAGLPDLMIRESARWHTQQAWGRLRGLLRGYNFVVVVLSMLMTLLLLLLHVTGALQVSEGQTGVYLLSLLLIPTVALSGLRAAALKGLGHIFKGLFPDYIIKSVLFLLLMGIVWVSGAGGAFTPADAMLLYVIAALSAYLIGAYFLFRELPAAVRTVQAVYTPKAWFKSAVPVAVSDGMSVLHVNMGIFLVGALLSAEDVGIFKVALQASLFAAFALSGIKLYLAPRSAKLISENKLPELQALAVKSARLVFLASLLIIAGLWLLGQFMLGLVYGEAYLPAFVPLLILAAGQSIGAYFGASADILMMAGFEKYIAWVKALAVLLSFVLALLLIPAGGIVGAALASALSYALWCLALGILVRIKVGIRVSAFGI